MFVYMQHAESASCVSDGRGNRLRLSGDPEQVVVRRDGREAAPRGRTSLRSIDLVEATSWEEGVIFVPRPSFVTTYRNEYAAWRQGGFAFDDPSHCD